MSKKSATTPCREREVCYKVSTEVNPFDDTPYNCECRFCKMPVDPPGRKYINGLPTEAYPRGTDDCRQGCTCNWDIGCNPDKPGTLILW